MALETATYIDGLVVTNPTATDPKSQGDDHLRLLKSTVKATFPSIAGAVTATQDELNIMDGVTASTAELNILDGATLSTAELNTLDGVTVSASDINDVVNKASLNSPAFTGNPTAPTPSPGDNDTSIATTAFVVQQAFSAALPVQPGGATTYVLTSTGGTAAWGFVTPDYLLMAQGVI